MLGRKSEIGFLRLQLTGNCLEERPRNCFCKAAISSELVSTASWKKLMRTVCRENISNSYPSLSESGHRWASKCKWSIMQPRIAIQTHLQSMTMIYIEWELVTYAKAGRCPNHKSRVKSAMSYAAAKHMGWKQMKHKGKHTPVCVLQIQKGNWDLQSFRVLPMLLDIHEHDLYPMAHSHDHAKWLSLGARRPLPQVSAGLWIMV